MPLKWKTKGSKYSKLRAKIKRGLRKSYSKYAQVKGTHSKASLSTFMMPMGAIVPDRLRTKLKYTSFHSLTATSGAIQQQIMRGNSLFDPDFTNAGHQPQGFDQFAALYQSYKVFASKVTVHVNCNTSAANYIFSVRPTADINDTSTDMSIEMEKPYALWKMGTQANPAKKISAYYSTAKVEGLPKVQVLVDDAYGAAMNANPVSQWYWIISATNADQQTTTNFNYYIEWEAYAELYDRKTLAQS